jgi:murein DD-endopeptidase MepM/ murein hydrolase activator NlpD
MASGPTRAGAARADTREAAALRRAAEGLEAYFVRQLVKEAKLDLGGGGASASPFADMLHDALADEIVRAGGLGLQEVVMAQLAEDAGAASPGAAGLTARLGAGAQGAGLPASRARAAYGAFAGAHGGAHRGATGVVSSGFGARVDPLDGHVHTHGGVDVAAPAGTAVGAARAGVVTRAEAAGTYGNLVVVDHGDGTETRYAHLGSIAVRRGDPIGAGAVIGTVGSTGRSTGPHLHFELRVDGEPVDPKNHLDPLKLLR